MDSADTTTLGAFPACTSVCVRHRRPICLCEARVKSARDVVFIKMLVIPVYHIRSYRVLDSRLAGRIDGVVPARRSPLNLSGSTVLGVRTCMGILQSSTTTFVNSRISDLGSLPFMDKT
jgi:hypothetical protein